jgi:hypothetical protein
MLIGFLVHLMAKGQSPTTHLRHTIAHMINPFLEFQPSNTMKTYEDKSPWKSVIVTSCVLIAVSCGKHSLEE